MLVAGQDHVVEFLVSDPLQIQVEYSDDFLGSEVHYLLHIY